MPGAWTLTAVTCRTSQPCGQGKVHDIVDRPGAGAQAEPRECLWRAMSTEADAQAARDGAAHLATVTFAQGSGLGAAAKQVNSIAAVKQRRSQQLQPGVAIARGSRPGPATVAKLARAARATKVAGTSEQHCMGIHRHV